MTVKDMKLLRADEGKVLVRADGAYGVELCVYAEEADDWVEKDKAEVEENDETSDETSDETRGDGK